MKQAHLSFGFGDTLGRQLEKLAKKDQLIFFWAITNYGLYKEEPAFDKGWQEALWLGMKDAIDNFGGIQRGAPRGNQNAKKNPAEPPDEARAESVSEPSITDRDAPAEDASAESIENKENQFGELNSIENKENQFALNKNKNINININTHTPGGPAAAPRGPLVSEDKVSVCVENQNETETAPGIRDPPPHPPPLETEPPEYDRFAALHPGQPPLDQNAYEKIRQTWNSHEYGVKLPECRVLLTNLNTKQREIVCAARRDYSVEEIINAIENYFWMKQSPEEVRLVLTFRDMFSFLETALPTFSDDKICEEAYAKKRQNG